MPPEEEAGQAIAVHIAEPSPSQADNGMEVVFLLRTHIPNYQLILSSVAFKPIPLPEVTFDPGRPWLAVVL
jgi:hypothetical protein